MAKYSLTGTDKNGNDRTGSTTEIADPAQLARLQAKNPGLKFELIPEENPGKPVVDAATGMANAMGSALAEKADTAVRQQIGDTIRDPKSTALGAGMLGILNGVSLGLADEIVGAFSEEKGKQLESAMQAAEAEHPYIYNAADIATGLIPGVGAAMGGAKLARGAFKAGKLGTIAGAALGATGAGALQGLGNQPQGQKDVASLDVAIPAAISGLTEGVGRVVPWGKIGEKISGLKEAAKLEKQGLQKVANAAKASATEASKTYAEKLPRELSPDLIEKIPAELRGKYQELIGRLPKPDSPGAERFTDDIIKEWEQTAKAFELGDEALKKAAADKLSSKYAAEAAGAQSKLADTEADLVKNIADAAALPSAKLAGVGSVARGVGEIVRGEYAKLPIVDQLYASVKEIESEIAAIGVPQSAEERARLKELTDELNTYKQDLIPYRVAPESQLKKRTDSAEEARKKSKAAAEERRTAAKKIWLDKAGVKK